IAQRTRLAMPARIESQQTHAGRRLEQAQRLADITAKAMLENEGPAGPCLLIMEINPSPMKERHDRRINRAGRQLQCAVRSAECGIRGELRRLRTPGHSTSAIGIRHS